MAIASRKTKPSLMQNDKVLLTIEYIVFSLLGKVLGNVLRVLPLVKYFRLYSSFNLAARALRFTRSMFWRALGGTKRFLLRKERSPLIWAGVLYLYCLLTASMQVKFKLVLLLVKQQRTDAL